MLTSNKNTFIKVNEHVININVKDKNKYSGKKTNDNKTNYNLRCNHVSKKDLIGKIIYYALIINLIYQIFSKISYDNKFSLKAYEITLRVKGTGTKQILNTSFTCPSKIYLKGISQKFTECHKINVVESGSQIKLEWNSVINNARGMFYGCNEITEIDLKKFDTSQVTDMSSMFKHCSSITSIDVSNLNTKMVKSMSAMFRACSSLSSINIKNFDTSSVTSTERMFSYCGSLKSIDITHFNTRLFSESYSMFFSNYELTSIDLSNFNGQRLTQIFKIFYDCRKLEYINFKNLVEIKSPYNELMFYNLPKNAVICLDSSKAPNIYNLAKQISCVIFSCNTDWRSVQKK